MKRRIQVKVWPEITSVLPAIIPIERIAITKLNPIDIDLSNVHKVDSAGLNILLVSLIKITQRTANQWDSIRPTKNDIDKLLGDLNFYSILIKNMPNHNLFWQFESINRKPFSIVGVNENHLFFPIYELDYSATTDRRDVVDFFKQYLIQNLIHLHDKYEFDLNVLIQVLVEIAKNGADHTVENAYFGLDIYEYDYSLVLKFSFGDLGIGINKTVRNYMRNDSAFKVKAEHLALTDSYHFALGEGNTTKPNSGVNRGIGMSTIYSLSKQLNANLSVYDANSRGFLSMSTDATHVELRKIFYNIGFNVGFCYYGEIEIVKK